MISTRPACLVVLALFAAAPAAQGQSKHPNNFQYVGEVSAVTSVSWEPRGNQILNEGFHISFWGSPYIHGGAADDCQPAAPDSSGSGTSNLFWASPLIDVGLEPLDWSSQWSPLSDSHCSSKGRQGYSYAVLRNENGGGIGLYTHSGANPTNSARAFFQPYPASGDRSNANANIVATFATFRNTPNTDDSRLTKPFSGNSTNYNELRTAIVSYQGLLKLRMEDPTWQQVRQQTEVTFLHRGCARAHSGNPPNGACHVQFLFLSAINGVNSSMPNAIVLADPAQSLLPVIAGALGLNGVTTYAQDGAGNSFEVWTSWGSPTLGATWSGQTQFQAEISFNQFLNILKLAAARKEGVPNANTVTAVDLNKWFGPDYNDRNQWILLQISLGQEVYNPVSTTMRAYVGGNATVMKVVALP